MAMKIADAFLLGLAAAAACDGGEGERDHGDDRNGGSRPQEEFESDVEISGADVPVRNELVSSI